MDREIQAQHYVALLEENPYDLNALGLLEQTFEEDGRWEDLVALLESRAPQSDVPDVAARLYLEAARMARTRLQDFERGLDLLKSSLVIGEDTAVSTESQLFEYAFQQDGEGLLEYFTAALEESDDDGVQSRLYQRMGCILEELMADEEEADNAYNYALELDAGNLSALWGRQWMARKNQQWGRLAELVYDEIQLTEDAARKADLSVKLGLLYLDYLDKQDDALKCFSVALKTDAAHEGALNALEKMGLTLDDDQNIVASTPPPEDGDHTHSGDELDARGGAEDSTVATDSLVEESEVEELVAGDIVEESSVDEVIDALAEESEVEELVAGDIVEESSVDEVVDALAEESEVEELVASDIVEESFADEEADSISVVEQAPSPEENGEQVGVSEELDSDESDALLAMTQEMEAANREELNETAVGPDDREPDNAAERIETEADDAELQEDVALAQENWRKLQRSLEERFADTPAELRNQRVYGRMAVVARALGDREKELHALSRVERELESGPLRDRLKFLYKESAKWPKYIELIHREIESLDESANEEKVALLYEIIRVYCDEMKHERMAIAVYKDVLALAPQHLKTLDRLIELYGRLNMVSDLIQVLQSKAELVTNDEEKVSLLSRIAELFIEKFRNQAEAIKAYDQILTLDPHHRPAIQALKQMHEKRRDWERLIEVSLREAECFEDVDARIDVYRQVAQLASDRLRKPELAVEHWQSVIALLPDDQQALDALELLYEKTRDYRSLVEVLKTKSELVDDSDAVQKLLHKIGMVYSERLNDVENSMELWQKCLERNADDLKARKSLERLYIEANKWDELESFYREHSSDADLVRILESLVGTINDKAVKIELLLRASRIWSEILEDTGRAQRNLERILQIEPSHFGAAQILAPMYEEAEDHEKLQSVYEVIISHLDDPLEKSAYYKKLAYLHQHQFEDWHSAFQCHTQVFLNHRPEALDSDDLELCAHHINAWQALAGLYEEALNDELEEQERALLQLKLANIFAERLERLDDAITHYNDVLCTTHYQREALSKLEQLYVGQLRWDDLMEIYQRRLELEDEPQERLHVLHGMATIQEEQAGDLEAAVLCYLDAYALDARHLKTLEQLFRLRLLLGEYSDAAEHLRQQIAVIEEQALLESSARQTVEQVDVSLFVPDAEHDDASEELSDDGSTQSAPNVAQYTDDEVDHLSRLHLQLATLCIEELDDYRSAVDSLTQVLQWRPHNTDAQAAMERCLEQVDFAPLAARALSKVYEIRGQWVELIRALEIQLPMIEEDSQKEALLERIAVIQLQELGDGHKSFEAYARLLKINPQHTQARQQLQRLALEMGLWSELVAHLEDALFHIDASDTKLSYFFELADVYANRLHIYGQAHHYYQEILEIEPDSLRALKELEELYTQTEQWLDLLGIYERLAALSEDAEEREQLKFKMAMLWEEFLSDKQGAIVVYRDVLAENSESHRALEELSRLLLDAQQWEELADILERRVMALEAAQSAEVRLLLADVSGQHLARYERAFELYEELITHQELQERVIAGLETMNTGENAPHARIAELLQPHYVAGEQWKKLVNSLELKLRDCDEQDARIEVLDRLAELYEDQLTDLSGAFEAYRRLLHEDATREQTHENLYRLSRALPAGQLASIYEEEAAQQFEPEVRRRLLRKASSLYVDDVQDFVKASLLLQQVLEMYPDDAETLSDLETIYIQLQQWPELIEVLSRKCELVDATESKKDLYYQVATLYEDALEDFQSAIEVYHQVLALDESDEYALERLATLHERLEQWHELIEVYQRRVNTQSEEQHRQELMFAIASVYQEKLHQAQDAIDVFAQLLETTPPSPAILSKLAELYEQTGQWEELQQILEEQLALTSDVEAMCSLQFQLAELWRKHLGDVTRALVNYRAILDVSDSPSQTLSVLKTIVVENADYAANDAANLLQSYYQQAQNWDELVDLYRMWIDVVDEPEKRYRLHMDMAYLLEHELKQPEQALDVYLSALNYGTQVDEVLPHLERLAAQLDQWPRLVNELTLRVEDELNQDLAVNLHLHLARIHEMELQDVDAAIDHLKSVLELDPTHAYAAQTLERLYQGQGQWEALASLLHQRIVSCESQEQAHGLRLQLGQIYQDALDDDDAAIDNYEMVLVEDASNRAACEALQALLGAGRGVERVTAILEPYFYERAEFGELIDVYLQRIEYAATAEESHNLLMRVGRLFVDDMSDFERGLKAFGAALSAKPDDAAVVEQIEQLAEKTDNWAQAAEMFADALNGEFEAPTARLSLGLRLARILETRLERLEDAEVAYQEALSIDENDPVALVELDRIYQHREKWTELSEILERRLATSYEESEILALKFRLAKLYQEQLHDVERAVSTYQGVLQAQPDHEASATQLELIFIEYQRWQELYELLEHRAQSVLDPVEQGELLKRMAGLAEDMLERPEDTIDLWARVHELCPEDLDALRELHRLYRLHEQWDELAGIIEREIDASSDSSYSFSLLEELGALYRDNLHQLDDAGGAFQRALEINPVHRGVLQALQEIHTLQADYDQLVDVLKARIALPDAEEDEKTDLWRELAGVYSDALVEVDQAVVAWKEVLALDPQDTVALERLEELLIQQGRWDEAVQLLEMKLDREEVGPEKIALLERMANLYEVQLHDHQAAARAYEHILELDASNMVASRALEMLYLEDQSEEALLSLVNVYINRAALAEHAPFERLEILREAAQIFEGQLSQADSALVVLLSALHPATLADESLTAEIERLARQTGLWDEVVSQYTLLLDDLQDEAQHIALQKQLGLWLAHELDRPDEAVSHLKQAWQANSDDEELIEVLDTLYRRLALWDELAQVLEMQAEKASTTQARIDAWRSLGSLLELQLGEADKAVEVYERILESDSSDLDALKSLERSYEAYDRWDELVNVLQRRASISYEPEESIALKLRTARILEERLEQFDRAIEVYRDVLNDDPGEEVSAQALERLYLQMERWDDVAQLYEQRLGVVYDSAEQVEMYERLAVLYEVQFEDVDRAIEAYRQIRALDSSHQEALQELARLYTGAEQWQALADLWQDHLAVIESPIESIGMLSKLGRLYREELEQAFGAIEAYQRILNLDPAHLEALQEMAALYEITENWDACVTTYAHLAEVLESPEEQADALFKVGTLYQQQLGDAHEAESRYLDVLSLDPEHRPSLNALIKLYEQKGDWQGAIHGYKQLEAISSEFSEKAYYLCCLGKLHAEHLGDDETALTYFESALEFDPEIAEAAEPLVEIYLREKLWERTVPLLQTLIEKEQSQGQSEEVLHHYHQQLAIAYESLEQDEAALREYLSAYELQPNDKLTLLGLGRLLFEHEEFEQAIKVFQVLLTRHSEALLASERVDIYYKMGMIERGYDDARKAQQYFDQAVEIDANHRPSLQALLELFSEEAKWSEVVRYTRLLLATEHDPKVQFAHYVRIGDICVEHLERTAEAIEAYREALNVDPDSVVILRKLLELFTNGRQWLQAIELLERLAQLEEDHARRAKYYYTVAVICRDELDDDDEAIRYFELALESDVKLLKAFEAIDRLLTASKEWKELERSYRRMLRRVTEADDGTLETIKSALWKNLGEIYRTRLGDLKTAVETFEVAAGFNPQDEQLRLILAELYQRVGDNPDGVIEQHRQLLKLDPFRVESYSLLFKSYIQKKDYDKAWCMAGALSFLQRASEAEEKFYRQYLGKSIPYANQVFNADMYQKLYHPEQDLMISYILGLLAQGVRSSYSQPLQKSWGIHKKHDMLDLDEPSLFSKVYKYSVRTLAVVPAPAVYLQADKAIGIRNANADPPAMIIGADIRQNSNDRALGFLVAKSLCWMLPQHYLGSIGYPTEFLKILFMAAMELTDPGLGMGEKLGPQGENILKVMNAMPGPMLLQLQKLMRQYLAQGENPNLSLWLTSTEYTADRAGFLLCGDIHQAATSMKNSPTIGKASIKEKIRALILFAISDEYFELREYLGLAIGK